jgi:hypothetical protein
VAEPRWFFYIYQDGLRVASGSSTDEADARREAAHYALMYGQDGPVKVVVRASPSPRGERGAAE